MDRELLSVLHSRLPCDAEPFFTPPQTSALPKDRSGAAESKMGPDASPFGSTIMQAKTLALFKDSSGGAGSEMRLSSYLFGLAMTQALEPVIEPVIANNYLPTEVRKRIDQIHGTWEEYQSRPLPNTPKEDDEDQAGVRETHQSRPLIYTPKQDERSVLCHEFKQSAALSHHEEVSSRPRIHHRGAADRTLRSSCTCLRETSLPADRLHRY